MTDSTPTFVRWLTADVTETRWVQLLLWFSLFFNACVGLFTIVSSLS